MRSDKVHNFTLGSGGQSKCKGRVCCRGPLADWVETWQMCYPYEDRVSDIFWTYRTPIPWVGEALEWFWMSVEAKRCVSGKTLSNKSCSAPLIMRGRLYQIRSRTSARGHCKCMGKVCCCGPLADWVEIWLSCYHHWYMAKDIFWASCLHPLA